MMILNTLRIYFHEFCELCNSAVDSSFTSSLAVLDNTTLEFVVVIYVDDFIVLMVNDVPRPHVHITYQNVKLMVRLDFEWITSKSEL